MASKYRNIGDQRNKHSGKRNREHNSKRQKWSYIGKGLDPTMVKWGHGTREDIWRLPTYMYMSYAV